MLPAESGKHFPFVRQNGDNLYLTGRNNDKLLALKAELSALNPSVTIEVFACDLADPAARDRLAGYAEERGMRFPAFCWLREWIFRNPSCGIRGKSCSSSCASTAKRPWISPSAFADARGGVRDRRDRLHERRHAHAVFRALFGDEGDDRFLLHRAAAGAENEGVRVTTVLPGGVYTRPDIVKEIESQGVWGKLSALSPAYVAEKA